MGDKSQFHELPSILEFFKKCPPKHKVFVDVGTFGGDLSNTWNLAMDHKWKGFLIEASPCRVEPICRDFHGANIRLACVAAGTDWGVAKFYRHNVSPHNSLLEAWKLETQHHSIHVATAPLTAILDSMEVPIDFDFLSIDIEGMDFPVMKKFMEDGKYHPAMIVTERDSYINVDEFYGKFGYVRLQTNHKGPNLFFVRSEFANEVKVKS
jgi:FkbM family methyltransferase